MSTKNFYHYQITDSSTGTELVKLTTTNRLDPKDNVLSDLALAFVSGIELENQIQQAQAGKFNRGAK